MPYHTGDICLQLDLSGQKAAEAGNRSTVTWKFVKYFNASDEDVTSDREPEGLQMPSVDDSSWRSLDLPHDWAIEGPFNDTT